MSALLAQIKTAQSSLILTKFPCNCVIKINVWILPYLSTDLFTQRVHYYSRAFCITDPSDVAMETNPSASISDGTNKGKKHNNAVKALKRLEIIQ